MAYNIVIVVDIGWAGVVESPRDINPPYVALYGEVSGIISTRNTGHYAKSMEGELIFQKDLHNTFTPASTTLKRAAWDSEFSDRRAEADLL